MDKNYRYMRMSLWTLILFVSVLFFGSFSEAASKKATITQKTGYTMNQDDLRKIMSKKLGTPYYKMDCSAYTSWVLQQLGTKKAEKGAIKDVKLISGRSSYVWEQKGALKVSYRPAVYNTKKEKWVWGKKKTTVVNKCMTTWKTNNAKNFKKAAKDLKIGDALLYQDHVALYFGKFSSIQKVASYLKKKCGMKGLKKGKTSTGNTCYRYKGRIVLVEYAGCGNQWRIHSTTRNGVIIDNDLTFHNGAYGGKWRATMRMIETTNK